MDGQDSDHFTARSWVLTEEQLSNSPSRSDGVAEEQEKSYGRKTCSFIQRLGQELQIGKIAISTAMIFFYRFYSRRSYRQHDRYLVAATCVFLAAKAEERVKKLRDVVKHFMILRNKQTESTIDLNGPDCAHLRDAIIKCERILLHTIEFDLDVQSRYTAFSEIHRQLKSEGLKLRQEVLNKALYYLNDSMTTTLTLLCQPRELAAVAFFVTAVEHDLPLLNNKPWREAVGLGSEPRLYEWCEILLEIFDESKPFSDLRFKLSKMAQDEKFLVPRSQQQQANGNHTGGGGSSTGPGRGP